MKVRIAVVVIWTAVIFALLLTPLRAPRLAGFAYSDKVAHFGLFFVTGFVGISGSALLGSFKARVWFGLAFGLVLAVVSEYAQSLTTYRTADPYDLMADLFGLASVIALYGLVHYWLRVRSGPGL